MLPREYEILEVFSRESSIPADAIHKVFDRRFDLFIIRSMVDSGLLSLKSVSGPASPLVYTLTASGFRVLWERRLADANAARQQAQQVAADEAEKQRVARDRKMDVRRDYILFVAGLLLGWLLGVITPQEVFKWFVSLFH